MPYFSNMCVKYAFPGGELGSFLEHVCKVRFPRRRTWLLSRTRVQSVASQWEEVIQENAFFNKIDVFLEHVCQLHIPSGSTHSQPSFSFEKYVTLLSHETACSVFAKSAYFPNTCAKYRYQLIPHTRNHHFPSRNTLYLQHIKNSICQSAGWVPLGPAAA